MSDEVRKKEYPGIGPHRSPLEREEHLEVIAKMDRRGYSQRRIAEMLGISQRQVGEDLKKLKKVYIESQIKERHEYVTEKLEQYREIREEAWLAWERSKEDFLRIQETHEQDPSAEDATHAPYIYKTVRTREGRLPANEYIRTVMSCLEAERDLLGLDAPKKLDMKQLLIDWDAVSGSLNEEVPDLVEAEIQRISDAERLLGMKPME
jgi:DNA-binding Lrp family transcriptional regulator